MPANSTTIVTGCCGFGRAQADYFRAFSCVEINTTFYRLPKLSTAERWRAAAPPGFQFALKAWQLITHPAGSPTNRRTPLDDHDRKHCGHFGFNATVRWAWDETYAVAQALGASVVLFQSPASFTATSAHIANVRRFFERAKRGTLHFAWEPRGSWDLDTVAGLCRELDLIHAIDPFAGPACGIGKLQYFRLHGTTGRKHRYSAEELQQLHEFCRAKPRTYCFFNTLAMAQDAGRFAALAGVSRQSPSR